jgi:hypothetical protein
MTGFRWRKSIRNPNNFVPVLLRHCWNPSRCKDPVLKNLQRRCSVRDSNKSAPIRADSGTKLLRFRCGPGRASAGSHAFPASQCRLWSWGLRRNSQTFAARPGQLGSGGQKPGATGGPGCRKRQGIQSQVYGKRNAGKLSCGRARAAARVCMWGIVLSVGVVRAPPDDFRTWPHRRINFQNNFKNKSRKNTCGPVVRLRFALLTPCTRRFWAERPCVGCVSRYLHPARCVFGQSGLV